MFCTLFIQRVCAIEAQEDEIRNLIKKINVTIGDIDIVDESNDIKVQNLQVYNIDIAGLETSFYPDPNVVNDGIVAKILAQADVKGEMSFNKILGKVSKAHADISASANGVSFNIGLKFNKNEKGLVESVLLIDDQCTIKIDDLDLTIKGLPMALQILINAIKGLIIPILKNQMGALVCGTLKDLVETNFTELFTQANEIITPYIDSAEPIDIPIGLNMINLQKSVLVDVLRYVLSVFIGIDGPLNINSLLNRFTKNTGNVQLSSIMSYFGSPLPASFSFDIESINATLSMTLNELNLSGLNTWKNFEALHPTSSHILDTRTKLESLGINLDFAFDINAEGDALVEGGTHISEKSDLDMQLNNNSLDLQIQLASPPGAGIDYTDKQCLNPDCIISLFSPDGTGVTKFDLETEVSNISIENDSEGMSADLKNVINNIVKLFVDNYSPMIPRFITGLVNTYGVTALNSFLNDTMRNTSCQYIADDPYNEFVGWTTYTAIAVVVFVMIIVCLMMFLSIKLREKNTNLESILISQNSSENNESMDNNIDGIGIPEKDAEHEVDEDDKAEKIQSNIDSDASPCLMGFISFFRVDDDASLLMHPKIPLYARVLIPMLILLNFALFVSSNTGIGASVFVKLALGDDKLVSLPSMFDFGLINSIVDMWKSKAYALAILVAVMSCAWPYIKLILMVITWIIPTTIISKKAREKILQVLDALGKWSLVDSFVMILMLVAFHFQIDFPIVSPEVKSPFTLFLYVYPAYGFVTLMLGTVFSLMLSHIILAVDRYVDSSLEETDGATLENKVALMTFCKRKWLIPVIIVMLIIALITLFCGLGFKSFSFDFVGLAGWAMSLLGYGHKNEYSVVELGLKVPGAAEFPNSFAVRFTQLIYMLVTIVIPIAHVACLFIMWVVPMRRNPQVGIYKACEVLYAWSCLDVFVVSVLAAVMEISQFARFMVGDKCEAIDPIIKMFFADESLIEGHETCFDVITVLLSGSWFLFFAAIFHDIATIIITRVADNAIKERNLEIEIGSKSDDSSEIDV